MKLLKYLCICLLMLCVGCSSIGSMEKENLNLDEAFKSINSEIRKGNYKIGQGSDKSIDDAKLLEDYGLKVEDVEDYYVQQSIVSADVGEIAIFHVEKEKEDIVHKAILQRIALMKEELKDFSYQVEIIDNAKIELFDSYYVFVAGVDALSVLQYIRSL